MNNNNNNSVGSTGKMSFSLPLLKIHSPPLIQHLRLQPNDIVPVHLVETLSCICILGPLWSDSKPNKALVCVTLLSILSLEALVN